MEDKDIIKKNEVPVQIENIEQLDTAIENKKRKEKIMEEFDKFYELVKPVSDYLRENYDPHTTVIITDEIAKIVTDNISVPIKKCETTHK